MMRSFKLALLTSLILSILHFEPVSASSLSCNVNFYSVDRITGENQFTNLGCFAENQFYDALSLMTTEAAKSPNVVVRHPESPSPLKVVAADRAMAYTQNDTYLSQTTINIFNNQDLTSFANYINQSNPLYYFGTHVKSKAAGTTMKPSDFSALVEVNGARGYIELVAIDLIPLIYVENRWLINFTTRSLDQFITQRIYPNITRYIVSDASVTTKNGTITLKQISIRIDNATTAATLPIDIAPTWLPNGTYYSSNGVHLYTDIDLKNPLRDSDGNLRTYLNYYSYLNLRSRTNYSGSELDEYFPFYFSANNLDPATSVMRETGQVFVDSQETYGVNALMIYAMAIHESAYGRSNYAVNRFNLFGWNAYDSDPSQATYYSSIQHAVTQHMGLNLRSYLDATNTLSVLSTFYGSYIGNKGSGLNTRYASDPFWSVKISSLAYRIDRYLGLKDYNQLSISTLSNSNRTYFREATLQNPTYTINARASFFSDNILSIINDTYAVQSTNPISNGNIITTSTPGLVPYNWASSIVYVGKQNITLRNNPSTAITVTSTSDTLLSKVTEFKWLNENELFIKGRGILNNTAMDDISRVTHTLTLISLDENQNITFNLDVLSENFNNFNGLTYTAVGFEGKIDMGSIPNGSYKLELTTRSKDTTGKTWLREPALNPMIPEMKMSNRNLYKVVLDSWNTMEYHLIKSNLLDSLSVSPVLPSEYMSVARIYTAAIDDQDNFNLKGLGYINRVNIGLNDDKLFKLILSSKDLEKSSYVFDMTPKTGEFNPSLSNFDYTYAWFEENLDFSNVEDGEYRLFLYIKSNQYEDIVEVRDFSFRNSFTTESINTKVDFIMRSARRNYDLKITRKATMTE